ncbi:MAG: hypothetical protein LLG01_00800 [Planctomycetaceae bacterium]|nr:hypothetical protein [Planctomycetaceae bacterium]
MAPVTQSELMPYGAEEQQLTHVEAEAVNPDALAIMERVTIDSQIATAKRYPRSISLFIERAQTMACVDDDTAKSCFYRRPVGKEGGKQVYAEGESIRLAEIVAASYDNLAIRAIIVEITPRYVKAVGMARDLERNYMASAECVESTVDKRGQPYSERQRMLIAKVAQSKAYRDAIFRVVPKALCKPIANAASEVALGKGLTLEQRRERVMQWIASLNISAMRVWKALGIAGPEEMGTSEMLTLTGIRSAIKDGDTNIDEAFPAEPGEQAKSTGGNAGVKALLKNGNSAVPGAGESDVMPTTPAPSSSEGVADPTSEPASTEDKQGADPTAQPPKESPTTTAAPAGTTATEKPEPGLYTCTACRWTGDKTMRDGRCPKCKAPKEKVFATADLQEQQADAGAALDRATAELQQEQKPQQPAKMRFRCLSCKREYAEQPKVCDCGSLLGFKELK